MPYCMKVYRCTFQALMLIHDKIYIIFCFLKIVHEFGRSNKINTKFES